MRMRAHTPLSTVLLISFLKQYSDRTYSGHHHITQVTAVEGNWEIIFTWHVVLKIRITVAAHSPQGSERGAVMLWCTCEFFMPQGGDESQWTREPRFCCCLVFSCYPNRFYDLFYFYEIFPLGHLMQLTTTASSSAPALERPPQRKAVLCVWLCLTDSSTNSSSVIFTHPPRRVSWSSRPRMLGRKP